MLNSIKDDVFNWFYYGIRFSHLIYLRKKNLAYFEPINEFYNYK